MQRIRPGDYVVHEDLPHLIHGFVTRVGEMAGRKGYCEVDNGRQKLAPVPVEQLVVRRAHPDVLECLGIDGGGK